MTTILPFRSDRRICSPSSVVSVNSYGYNNQPNVMYGPYQGSVAQSLYNAAAAG